MFGCHFLFYFFLLLLSHFVSQFVCLRSQLLLIAIECYFHCRAMIDGTIVNDEGDDDDDYDDDGRHIVQNP